MKLIVYFAFKEADDEFYYCSLIFKKGSAWGKILVPRVYYICGAPTATGDAESNEELEEKKDLESFF